MVLNLLLIVAMLLGVLVQDILWRKVYVLVFPVMALLFVIAAFLNGRQLAEVVMTSLINLSFLVLQFLLLSVYFFIKNKRRVKLTGTQLGLGDIFFLLTIIVYFSALNFILFYVTSLIMSLLLWFIWRWLAANPGRHIPLAGLQALIMIGFLGWDFLERSVDLTNDAWLMIKLYNIS
jgi:hypothetical protein